MTQEDKKLLLKDLCARLPYGTLLIDVEWEDGTIRYKKFLNSIVLSDLICDEVKSIKPYLRPMSSMTEEEEKEYSEIFWNRKADYIGAACVIDWLLKHHFDFRNLIGLGLALEAPVGMYDLKDK